VARVKNLRERLVQRWQQLLKDPAASLSVDDRSDAMATLRETLIALERPEQAKEIAEQQRALLDEAANKAKTPMAAMTYNWPRAEVYVYLERPLDLVPALEKSAHELPGEYDPPARLGWVLLKAGKFEEAATWTDKALALSYGPRKARLLSQRAEIANKLNDFPVEHSLREQVVQLLESLPANQTSPQALAAAKKALAAAVQK
jgi:tetratricopeptide (TPR) repeat protein